MIYFSGFRKIVYNRIQTILKRIKNKRDRLRLTNKDFSIITNHCMGGFVYHDLGLRFLSPTINLKILPEDFVEFLKHLDYYLRQPIELADKKREPYPVGKIARFDGCGHIFVHFVHYHNFDDAVARWQERTSRINWNNIIVMMTARDGCANEILSDFEQLPYQYKVCYTRMTHKEFPHCKFARHDDGRELKGYISDMVNIYGKRAYECNGFDYIAFLNKEDDINYK